MICLSLRHLSCHPGHVGHNLHVWKHYSRQRQRLLHLEVLVALKNPRATFCPGPELPLLGAKRQACPPACAHLEDHITVMSAVLQDSHVTRTQAQEEKAPMGCRCGVQKRPHCLTQNPPLTTSAPHPGPGATRNRP